jgi:hypothetical protein
MMVDSPEIGLYQTAPSQKVREPGEYALHPHLHLPLGLEAINIGSVDLVHLDVDYEHQLGDSTMKRFAYTDVSAKITSFKYDSTEFNDPSGPLFYSKDIRIDLGKYRQVSRDSLFTFSFKNAVVSTGDSSLSFDSVMMIPKYDKEAFGKKTGCQRDWTEVIIPGIRVSEIDFKHLAENQKFHAGEVTIRNMQLTDYKDKRLPQRQNHFPRLPQELIRGISFGVSIDTFRLADSKAVYMEQHGDLPGILNIDGIQLIATGITNDSSEWKNKGPLKIDASCYLMGKGHVSASFRLPLDEPNDTFEFHGNMGRLALENINPIITPILKVKILSGTLDTLKIDYVNANIWHSTGILQTGFSGVQVNLHTGDQSGGKKWITGLVQFVVNEAIPEDRNPRVLLDRRGFIYCERDSSKSFLNYVWKSVFSGLKSSVGFNKPEQRKLKKEFKEENRRQNNRKF